MSSQQKVKNGERPPGVTEPFLTRNEFITMVGLVLVVMGIVFFLAESGTVEWGSPWWTLFIGIPGLIFLEAGVRTVRHHGSFSPMSIAQFFIGGAMTLIAVLFLVDPTWQFARGWALFSGGFWGSAWRWIIVLAGAAILGFAIVRRSVVAGVFGGIVAAVGLIFVFDIDWGRIWPLFIVAVGVGILALLFVRRR